MRSADEQTDCDFRADDKGCNLLGGNCTANCGLYINRGLNKKARYIQLAF